MSSINGFPSNSLDRKTKKDQTFVSIVPTDNKNRAGMDVLPKALFKVDLLPKTAEALDQEFNTTNSELKVIKLTGHSFRKGDVVRFDTTAGLNANLEISVSAVSANYILLAGILNEDPVGQDFFHCRHITLTITEDGQLTVSQGALSFIRDGSQQQVIEDTVDSNNTVGLPVQIVGADGTQINLTAGDINIQSSHTGANPDSIQIGDGTTLLGITLANEAKTFDATTHTALGGIDTKIDATNTALGGIDTKIDATNTKLDEIKAINTANGLKIDDVSGNVRAVESAVLDLDASTQANGTKLDAIIANTAASSKIPRVIETYFNASLNLNAARQSLITVPAGFIATEIEVLTKAGDNFKIHNDAAAGDIIGRFTQAGGKVPIFEAAGTDLYIEQEAGAFIASDLTVNLIGVPV